MSQRFINTFDSDQQQPQQKVNQPSVYFSVLKYLSRPLQILQGGHNYELCEPICIYEKKLTDLPQNTFPTTINTAKKDLQNTKLMNMEQTSFQHQKVRQKFQKQLLYSEKKHENRHKQTTLFEMYKQKIPYYCRFPNSIKKNNFANLFIDIAGINLNSRIRNKYFPKLNKEDSSEKGSIIFDSNFQSGNLLYVYMEEVKTISNLQSLEVYNLIIQNDTNTYGHNQWFYFKASSVKKYQKVRFNILNLIKSDSLFNYGLKPLVFSQKNNKTNGYGWIRAGQNVNYQKNIIRRQNKQAYYFTLSFQYCFKDANDFVYFCPSYPYTYSQMVNYVQNLTKEPKFQHCLTIKTLCQTVSKNKLNIVTISTGKKSISQCKIVWILARQHPTQTTSSYMIQGILKYLLSLISSNKFQNNQYELLDNYVFKIVPMINVDGVIHGNSRTQLTGVDPNRMWKKPIKKVCPNIWHLSKQMQNYKENINLVLDLHSHSKKTGCFFYGNEVRHNPKLSKLYPSFVCENDIRFTLKNCRFRGGYDTTARSVLFQKLKIPNIFTVQCSLLGYIKNNRIVEYSISDYHQMGARLIQCYLRLENIKLTISIEDIINQYSKITDQICEVDSARSDSSLSDEEYQEVKIINKNNNKKKSINKHKIYGDKKILKNQKEVQQKSQLHQRSTLTAPKYANKSYSLHKVQRKRVPSVQNNEESIFLNQNCIRRKKLKNFKTINKENNNFSETSSFKYLMDRKQISKRPYLKGTKPIRLNCQNISPTNKDFISVIQKKQACDASIQVQMQIPVLEANDINCNSKIKDLCVVGGSFQTHKISVHKNQVSIQIYLQPKQNIQKCYNQQKSSPLAKLPRLISYLNSRLTNALKQNGFSGPKPIKHQQINQTTKN